MVICKKVVSKGWCKESSCITMSLFLVMYIHFSCNINKWLSLKTISLNIFDRVPVAQKWPVGTQRSTTGGPKVARWQTGG